MKEKRPYFWPILAFLLLNISRLLTKRSDSVSSSMIYLTQAFLENMKKEFGLKLFFLQKWPKMRKKSWRWVTLTDHRGFERFFRVWAPYQFQRTQLEVENIMK